MKTPRDVSGSELVKALRVLGYERVRQDGSHIRVTTQTNGQHHLSIPNHNPLKIHHRLSLDALMTKLDL